VSPQSGAGPLAPELEIAATVIEEAASLARQGRRTPLDIAEKSGPADLVTQVDRDLDALIVARLRARFPADGSLSEEGGHRPGTSGRTWVIDPIDGTHNYIAGLPYYGISIALMDGSRTLLGLVLDATDGTVHAATAPDGALGQISAQGPDEIQAPVNVSSALVAVSLPAAAIFAGSGLRPPLNRIGDIRITGSLSLDLAWTAAGWYDACAYRHLDNPGTGPPASSSRHPAAGRSYLPGGPAMRSSWSAGRT
jgi:myo-inositol-1(or 4)-monophosphatase